ncbi:MAG TPA: diguanylate cyclase [Trueperaceae bacterium]|nr:diguanylate cyclase [Trueperaceae bacterium]
MALSWQRWTTTGLILASIAFVVTLATGAGPLFEAPPLLLAGALATVLANVVWGGVAVVVGWVAVVVVDATMGWGALAYLAATSLLIVVLTDRLVAEMRQRREDAERGLGLLSVLLAGLRRVAAGAGNIRVGSTLPGVLEGAGGTGFAVWRTLGEDPEPVAGDVDAVVDASTVDAVRRVVVERRAVARKLETRGGVRHLEAFPVEDRGDVAAVVTSSQSRPLGPAERAVVEEFAGTLGKLMQHGDEERTGRLVLELVEHHAPGAGTAAVSRALLDLAVPELGAWGGVVMRYGAGRFVAEAATDSLPPALRNRLVQGLAYGQGVVWQARRDGEPLFIDDYGRFAGAASELAMLGTASVAVVPVGGAGASHVVLLLHDAQRSWSARERVLLTRLAQVLGASVRHRTVELRAEETARLQRELLATPPEDMYARLLDAAKRLVPGTEAASLLVRGDDGAFRYVATAGYDLQALSQVRWTDDDMRTWYARDLHGWREGEPRVVVSAERRSVADISALTMPSESLLHASRVRDIVANLCLPVVYGGEVLAVLNLDALQDPTAFTAASVEAASGLAPFVGFLLQESYLRDKLEAAARSDALTGLGNRRAFDEQASRDVARAVRHGEALSLLLLDLQDFKALNDAVGHDAGDRALVAVADALRGTVRAGDAVYRWGGDEFAALLAHADAPAAVAVARRIAAAVAEIATDAGRVAVNIGVASVPDDGEGVRALMQAADTRMYAAKAGGLAVMAPADAGAAGG